MPSEITTQEVVDQVVSRLDTERAKAVALHDYVRDCIPYGFTKYFDKATPEQTLAINIGHCVPKSRLLVALFHTIGLESYMHFVVLPRDILRGLIPPSMFWMIAQVSHAYTEVKVDGSWYEIDSYSADTALLKAGKSRLAAENSELGYGVRPDSVNVWDGHSNAFSQFDQHIMIEDHGRVEDPERFFHSKSYRNRFLGIPFNTTFRLMGDFGVGLINTTIARVRG